MSKLMMIVAVIVLILGSSVLPASAYIGPGLGLGVIGTVLGVILSVFLAVFAVVWYPIKRWIRRRK